MIIDGKLNSHLTRSHTIPPSADDCVSWQNDKATHGEAAGDILSLSVAPQAQFSTVTSHNAFFSLKNIGYSSLRSIRNYYSNDYVIIHSQSTGMDHIASIKIYYLE